MSSEKRWRLICYDIRDDKRYRQVHKIVTGAGESVQYSVFRARLDDLEVERLRWRLANVMAPEDALLIVDLCPRCARNVIARNHVEGWAEEPSPFRIIGASSSMRPIAPLASVRPSEQAPKAVAESGAPGPRNNDDES